MSDAHLNVNLQPVSDANPIPVKIVEGAAAGGPGGGASASDRELVVSTYRVMTAFSGGSPNDTVTSTQIIDVSSADPVTIRTIWRNQSTGIDLAGAPPVSVLDLLGSQALTDAQLRASPVAISGVRPNDGSAPAAGSSHVTIGGSDGVNLRPLLVDNFGRQIVAVNGVVAVSGPLTDTQLRASPVSVTEQAVVYIGAANQTAVVNNIIESAAGANGTDVSNMRSASVQVISTGTGGTFIFEQSNDGTNWRPLPVFNAELVTGVPIVSAITATASAIIYSIPIRCVFMRLRIVTAITGGSITARTRLSSEPWTASVYSVAQPTAGSLNVTVAQATAANLQATVTGTVTSNVAGQGAEDAAAAGNAVRVGGRVRTAAPTTFVAGDAVDHTMTTGGSLVTKAFSAPETDWQYAAAAGGIVVATAVAVKAAVASLRNYVTAIDLYNASTTVTTDMTILDNTTVIWRTSLPPGARIAIQFPTPLRGSLNTAINVQCGTAGVVYANAQGFVAL